MGQIRSQRFTNLVRDFNEVPMEICQQILSDVRVWDVLRLLVQNDTWTNACIASHPLLAPIFSSDEVVAKTREIADIYWDACMCYHLAAAPPDSPLALNVQALGPAKQNLASINHYMLQKLGNLWSVWYMDLDKLRRHSTTPDLLQKVWDLHSVEGIKARRDAIHAAQKCLNEKKTAQIFRAADLLESNPDILKKTVDPSQVQRKNVGHLVSRYMIDARKISKENWARGDRKRGAGWFADDQFPVAPFDEALGLVVKELEAMGAEIYAHADQSVVAQWMVKDAYKIDSDLQVKIETFVSGLRYLFKVEAEPGAPVNRIGIESDSDGESIEKRVFIQPTTSRDWDWRYDPHDEREIAWLEAFVAVYRSLVKQ
ncbi:hypothetical protein BDV25DRAFT_153543 [Aspergillus avenaceus]|uniref:F-box domain-containing protein n=1 Tax=Aspergillus avenaceus TaxID=36643 RepID=A0A5N6TX22_ASPAV|nr:hypothetical protein BDV25DRAFT_153543 [Aspergillus avenaceus]